MKNKDVYIAVDFDGTCVKHWFPEVDEDIGAAPVLRRLVSRGFKLILNTMRSGQYLQDAVKWFQDNGIELFGINENPTQKEWTTSPKVYAHLYIDDAALGCPVKHDRTGDTWVDWKKVEEMLQMEEK